MLASSYYALYKIHPEVEEYVKKASNYSPDLNDRQNGSAYFYDAALLTGKTKQIGFKEKYLNYLVNNGADSTALELLSEITFEEPTTKNLQSLKDLHAKTNTEESFSSYWEKQFDKRGKSVPLIQIRFENEMLSLMQKPNYWIYIDIWGTWCKPCCRELPFLQEFFVENNKNAVSNLKVYTFSYRSQNLHDFLQKNNYTFPVSEIDQHVKDLFEVEGFPTKILISPNGKYIKIPFGVDWRTYIKNYTLM